MRDFQTMQQLFNSGSAIFRKPSLESCMVILNQGSAIGTCRPRHTRALPGFFCILISRGPDTKTCGMLPDPYIQHMHAYARTNVRIVCSVVSKYTAIAHQSSVAKVCLGTHTALQAPMSSATQSYQICSLSVKISAKVHQAVPEYKFCCSYRVSNWSRQTFD